MQTIPGIKMVGNRTSPLPTTEVQCRCGHVVVRLAPDEAISLRGARVGRTEEGICPTCGEGFRVPIAAEK